MEYEQNVATAYRDEPKRQSLVESAIGDLANRISKLEDVVEKHLGRLSGFIDSGDYPMPADQELTSVRQGSSPYIQELARMGDRIADISSRILRVDGRLEV